MAVLTRHRTLSSMTMLDNTRLRLRLWISKVCNRFICTPYYNFRGFLARNQAKPIPEQVAQLLASRNRLLGDDPKLVIKAARDCSKYLAALRLGLIGNSKSILSSISNPFLLTRFVASGRN